MATKGAYRRLTKEYMALQKSPPDYIVARPLENNILEWHYLIEGPPDTPYHTGTYHGKLIFPADYPFKPPSIRMTTPSGRFQTDTRLCLTMSDFHPSHWNPSWSVATILNGLLSFMCSDEATTGSIRTSDAEKKIYAARSHTFNLANPKFRGKYYVRAEQEACNKLLSHHPLTDHPTKKTQNQSQMHQRNTAAKGDATSNDCMYQAPILAGNPQTGALNWTLARWRRWLLVVVVFGYLLLARAWSRSSSS
ncbi:hypothetical protein BZG36_04643 [Bifiguratus adelaidae]|uniref:Ubiquitin-conjugating enzyme E2 6 n=1 Tax=Bifiguratus adelaidae TaxID=1938954 RepID=A0A261XXP4_9FUNG|nr:hypothetical protein BZG36_04643 [Bifiguratus adelaidae]